MARPKRYCSAGSRVSVKPRAKPPTSQMLDAPGPPCVSSHSPPTRAGPRASPSTHATPARRDRRTCRNQDDPADFPLTRGASRRTGMPSARRCSAGPTPESTSSCGLLMVPPERITSRVARTDRNSPSCRYSIPTARSASNRILRAIAPTSTARVGRRSAARCAWCIHAAEPHRFGALMILADRMPRRLPGFEKRVKDGRLHPPFLHTGRPFIASADRSTAVRALRSAKVGQAMRKTPALQAARTPQSRHRR